MKQELSGVGEHQIASDYVAEGASDQAEQWSRAQQHGSSSTGCTIQRARG